LIEGAFGVLLEPTGKASLFDAREGKSDMRLAICYPAFGERATETRETCDAGPRNIVQVAGTEKVPLSGQLDMGQSSLVSLGRANYYWHDQCVSQQYRLSFSVSILQKTPIDCTALLHEMFSTLDCIGC